MHSSSHLPGWKDNRLGCCQLNRALFNKRRVETEPHGSQTTLWCLSRSRAECRSGYGGFQQMDFGWLDQQMHAHRGNTLSAEQPVRAAAAPSTVLGLLLHLHQSKWKSCFLSRWMCVQTCVRTCVGVCVFLLEY